MTNDKSIDLNEIIDTIEKADCIFPHLDGVYEYLSFDNVVVSISPYDLSEYGNRICLAKFNENNAESEVADIINQFKNDNRHFFWIVGPNSTPENLNQYLIKAGLKKLMMNDGLYITPSVYKQRDNIQVVAQDLSDMSEITQVMAEAFGIESESSMAYNERLKLFSGKLEQKIYLAYIDGEKKPVGVCYLTYYPGKKYALLGGAATIPEYRNRGLYREMLIQRIHDAKDDGVKALVITADVDTSAPICLKFGFKKACDVTVFKL